MMGSTPAYAEPFVLGGALADLWGFLCDWMYANAGTSASVISAIAAILAIWVAVRIQKENTAPNVIAYIEKTDGASLALIIKNIGTGVAYDVSINDFDMGMVQTGNSPFDVFVSQSFVINGIPMLAPGCSRETVLTTTRYAEEHLLNKTWDTKISWSSSHGGKPELYSVFTLEYTSFFGSVYTETLEERAVKAVEKISRSASGK